MTNADPEAPKKKLLSRRDFAAYFAQITSFAFILFQLFFSKKLKAQSVLTPAANTAIEGEESCVLTEAQAPLAWPSDNIYYFIDGFHIAQGVTASRGTLAVLIKHKQEAAAYIDKVVLSDEQNNLMGARYFKPQDKMDAGGFVPYLIFDQLDLKNSGSLQLYIQLRRGATIERYRYVFAKNILVRSKLNQIYLPAALVYDIRQSHKGYISGFYRFASTLKPDHFGYHLVKPYVYQIGADGSFSIQIPFMHKDESDTHYNRYFFATDPVGRLLGIIKRKPTDKEATSVLLNQLSEAQRNEWGLVREDVARITDCPYIMVFVDDMKECLMQANVWLR